MRVRRQGECQIEFLPRVREASRRRAYRGGRRGWYRLRQLRRYADTWNQVLPGVRREAGRGSGRSGGSGILGVRQVQVFRLRISEEVLSCWTRRRRLKAPGKLMLAKAPELAQPKCCRYRFTPD